LEGSERHQKQIIKINEDISVGLNLLDNIKKEFVGIGDKIEIGTDFYNKVNKDLKETYYIMTNTHIECLKMMNRDIEDAMTSLEKVLEKGNIKEVAEN
jgi:hypothetical protein